MAYYYRTLESNIKRDVQVFPVVFINGPRQAGKSTLTKHLSQSFIEADYVTFDNINVRSAAEKDPEGFLRSFKKTLIIDEVQIVPGLFRILKILVDENRLKYGKKANGKFILTGSANVMLIPELSDALVGRMSTLSLYPLSACELFGKKIPVINGLFDQDFFFSKIENKNSIAEVISKSTFPELVTADKSQSDSWFDSYLNTLLQRDIRQLTEIEKVSDLPNIVKLLASRAGSLLNDADCARDAKLNNMTYSRYRILLQNLFLINTLPPWYRNTSKRVVKSPKLYFVDTSLLCNQLGVDIEVVQKNNPGLFGHILENFVYSELLKQLSVVSDCSLYHYRTHDNKEVDFVIERKNGNLIGIEVKSSKTIVKDDFKGLEALKKESGNNFIRGIVLYQGDEVIAFGNNMFAIPIQMLWSLNMEVKKNLGEIKYDSLRMSYYYFSGYGSDTEIKCIISYEAIADHFYKGSDRDEAIKAINKYKDIIQKKVEHKILSGEVINTLQGKEVILTSGDFGREDYRK